MSSEFGSAILRAHHGVVVDGLVWVCSATLTPWLVAVCSATTTPGLEVLAITIYLIDERSIPLRLSNSPPIATVPEIVGANVGVKPPPVDVPLVC